MSGGRLHSHRRSTLRLEHPPERWTVGGPRPDRMSMPFRDTLLNLAITCVLVLIIVLVAVLLKESRPAPLQALPVAMAQVAVGQATSDASRMPLQQFKIFPKAKLIESRANEADTLRIKVSDTEDEHIFVLYFVDAPDTSLTQPLLRADSGGDQPRQAGVSGGFAGAAGLCPRGGCDFEPASGFTLDQ